MPPAIICSVHGRVITVTVTVLVAINNGSVACPWMRHVVVNRVTCPVYQCGSAKDRGCRAVGLFAVPKVLPNPTRLCAGSCCPPTVPSKLAPTHSTWWFRNEKKSLVIEINKSKILPQPPPPGLTLVSHDANYESRC